MPIYDYRCKNCNHEYETMSTSIREAEEVEEKLKCPLCGSTDKERQIAKKTSFTLKGRGWARDRYSGKQTDQNADL